jgi:hypothetical protein
VTEELEDAGVVEEAEGADLVDDAGRRDGLGDDFDCDLSGL